MDVVSLCPLRASGFDWQAHSGTHAHTVIVKATFTLKPGECPLALEQEPINEEDEHWNDDPARSVVAPSDRAPFKLRADVMLVGNAYAPGGQPVRSVTTRLSVGDIDKSIDVWCDRAFRAQDGQLVEGSRFNVMPIRWERAAFDADATNPAGLRFDASPDAYGMIPIPNLQPPGMTVSKRSDTFVPVCFGPIAMGWPERVRKLGRAAGELSQPGWEKRPLPESLDASYFQAAPRDQRVPEIRPSERIVLQHLHPEHAHFVTRLPGIFPRAVAERATGERDLVKLLGDTLWIDTDRGICAVVWRGRIGLRHAKEAGRIAVTLEGVEVDELPPQTLTRWETPAAAPVMPFQAEPRPRARHAPSAAAPTSGWPFAQRNQAEEVPPLAANAMYGPGVPPAPPSAPKRVPSAWPAAPSSPTSAASPWGGGASGNVAPARDTIGAAIAAVATGPDALTTDRAAREGVAAASTAAAGATPWSVPKPEARRPLVESEAPPPETPAEFLQLLWYDADSLARMRRVPAWKQIIIELERRPRSREIEVVEGARDPWEIEDRKEVLQILAKGVQTDGRGVKEALQRAVDDDGKLSPPLVLLATEIELPFDELEALKAAMSTASPLVTPPDEGLRAAVQTAKDFLQTPGLSAAPAVSEGLTARIREAFAKEKALPADYLSTQMERVLLAGRHYQKREVFGGKFLRCQLWPPGEADAIVGYLPEEASRKLPMWKRFRVRLIAEVHPAQDQYETPGHAVKVLGVARVGAQAKG